MQGTQILGHLKGGVAMASAAAPVAAPVVTAADRGTHVEGVV